MFLQREKRWRQQRPGAPACPAPSSHGAGGGTEHGSRGAPGLSLEVWGETLLSGAVLGWEV